MLADVMLDCRWLPMWGAGRVTELMLRGFAESPPSGRWVLWGPDAVKQYAWPGAEVVVDRRDPRVWCGQRAWLDVPPARLAVFLHQQRPLCRTPAVTIIYDTIQIRHGGAPWERRARRVFLRRVAATSRAVFTISEHSRMCIQRDLGVDEADIAVVHLPVDWERATAIARRRQERLQAGVTDAPMALFVGRLAPHKNVDRLVRAFAQTALCAEGGRLVLAGGRDEVALEPRPFLDVRPWCDEGELDDLMTGATLLVQPSLEEGFSYPVAEAMAAGVPVCVSDGGAVSELIEGLVDPFRATSVEEMARSLDITARAARRDPSGLADRLIDAARQRLPAPAGFAREFVARVEAVAALC